VRDLDGGEQGEPERYPPSGVDDRTGMSSDAYMCHARIMA
jgi:hypothetical protein